MKTFTLEVNVYGHCELCDLLTVKSKDWIVTANASEGNLAFLGECGGVSAHDAIQKPFLCGDCQLMLDEEPRSGAV
jgi:hypothetical protein